MNGACRSSGVSLRRWSGSANWPATSSRTPFVTAVRRRESFARVGSLDGWIWRIVINAARDARASRVETVEVLDSSVPESDDRRAGVRAAVGGLPERQRLVLFLRYYADLDYHAIAEALSISQGTVAATLNAAHSKLRDQLTEVTR
jgi:RNA polymerase sigma-70 factor (ECF subfamily)